MFKRKLGLALGGGGARGLAHLGVIKHIEEINCQVDALSGTSAGAIVAALYAYQIPLETMIKEIAKLRPAEWTQLRFRGLGLFQNVMLEEMLRKLLPKDATIEGAKIPLGIKVTDLITGKGVDLYQGDLVQAVLASSCVPGVYTPVEKDGMLLVDGALVENVPIAMLKFLGANFFVGVNLNGNQQYGRPDGVIDVLTNAMDIAIDSHTKAQLRHADIVVSMDLTKFSRTKTDHIHELIDIGLQHARESIGPSSKYLIWGFIRKSWRKFKAVLPFRVKIPNFIKKYLQA